MNIYPGTVTHGAPAVTLHKATVTIGASSSSSCRHLNRSLQEANPTRPVLSQQILRPTLSGESTLALFSANPYEGRSKVPDAPLPITARSWPPFHAPAAFTGHR